MPSGTPLCVFAFVSKHGTAEPSPCGSTDAQTITSVEERKRGNGIVGSRKEADAIPRFCRNPQMRISVKA